MTDTLHAMIEQRLADEATFRDPPADLRRRVLRDLHDAPRRVDVPPANTTSRFRIQIAQTAGAALAASIALLATLQLNQPGALPLDNTQRDSRNTSIAIRPVLAEVGINPPPVAAPLLAEGRALLADIQNAARFMNSHVPLGNQVRERLGTQSG